MVEAATYSAVETLRDGRGVDIRALRPDDRAELLAAVGRTSLDSLYHRFFYVKRGFTEQEMAYFLNIDFVDPRRCGGGGQPAGDRRRRALHRPAARES